MESEAKKRFINTMLKRSAQTAANFEAVMSLARTLSQAEQVGYKIDPSSVEKAIKNVLGVD